MALLRLPLRLFAAAMIAIMAIGGVAPAQAQTAEDFPVEGGWFYTQTRGGHPAGYGFAVLDVGGVPMWTSYRDLHGPKILGYPLSHRFIWDRFPAQVFEAGVLHFRADVGVVQIVNVIDWLGQNGFDEWLFATYGAAPSLDWRDDVRFSWEFVQQRHFALLEASPRIRSVYFGASGGDPVTFYGLPQSVVDHGSSVVVRAQRAIFQEWKQDVPWAKAGTVTIIHDGEALIASGVVPDNASAPLLPPAALALAGFPPVSLRGGQSTGTAPRAPAPPPDAPCPPYAPVQPFGPTCGPAPRPAPAPPLAPAPGYAPVPVGPIGPPPGPVGPPPGPVGPPPGPGYAAPYPPVGPVPLPFPGGGPCLGDEAIQFVPNPAPANVEFSIEVSSNRYTLGVGLSGPGSIRLREVVAGGKGTVWKFAVIAPRGTWNYVFTRDGGAFACVQGTVTVN